MGKLLRRADRRRDGRQGLPERGLGHRERHDRAAEDRRARHDAHQRRAAEQCRPRDDRPGAAVPVPLGRAHARRARRAGRRRDPGRDGSAGHGRAGLLRQRRPLDVYRDQADQEPGRRRAHEDPGPAVGPVRGHGRGAGRQPDADAVRRGLHRAEDRHRRCRREQLPVLRVLAPVRGRQVLHADRALDGARGAGVLQGDLGHADAGGSGQDPQGRQGLGALHAQALGRARGASRRRRSRPAAPRSCRSRTGRPGSTRCSRSTRSSRTRRSCRAWSRRSRPPSKADGEAALRAPPRPPAHHVCLALGEGQA